MSDLSADPTARLLRLSEEAARTDIGRDSQKRYEFVGELHRRGGADVFAAAARWCANPDPLLRSLGADVLGQLGAAKDRPSPFADESAGVLRPLLADADPRVIESALVALGHLRSGDLPRIVALAMHEAVIVRHGVAFCLGGREDDLALGTLLALMRDVDAGVRDWATFAVGTLSAADSAVIRDALGARLTDEDANTRGEAMRGLAMRRDERVVPAIVAELQRPSVSDLAIEAATEMPRPEFVPHLDALVADNPTASHLYEALDACRSADRGQ
jgi:HEAT repeat protein